MRVLWLLTVVTIRTLYIPIHVDCYCDLFILETPTQKLDVKCVNSSLASSTNPLWFSGDFILLPNQLLSLVGVHIYDYHYVNNYQGWDHKKQRGKGLIILRKEYMHPFSIYLMTTGFGFKKT